MSIGISRTFTTAHLCDAWGWLQEYPSANFDDYGPRTINEFCREIELRMEQGEQIFWITNGNGYAGFVGYKPITEEVGTLHGVCFGEGKLSREQKRESMEMILQSIFDAGVRKICAGYFSDNTKIARLLADLGFVYEGTFRAQTRREGALTDMVQVARFEESR